MLRDEIEATKPGDYKSIARAALAARSPAGLLFMNKVCSPDKWWRDLSAARLEANISSVFTAAMSIDVGGSKQEWGIVLPDGAAKQFIAGTFTSPFLWKLVKGICVERESLYVIHNGAQDPASFATDPTRLRYAETPLKAAFATIGYKSSDKESWLSFYRMQLMLASQIEAMPNHVPQKEGLRQRLGGAARGQRGLRRDRARQLQPRLRAHEFAARAVAVEHGRQEERRVLRQPLRDQPVVLVRRVGRARRAPPRERDGRHVQQQR
jgi:hypothetical protein